MKNVAYRYDTIIVGAGIGGLVCGCYLAKAGRRVLIIEKNSYVGGCCSSFRRTGFIFDSGAHILGSCRKDGQVGMLLKDIGLEKKISLLRINPSDFIVTPDFTVQIDNDAEKTIDYLSVLFPAEKDNIRKFIHFITRSSFTTLFRKLRDVNFADFVSSYFSNQKLRAVFKILTGYLYEKSSRLSAVAATVMLKEVIFDGGYYPQGGMQQFSDLLGKRFKEFGGTLLTNAKVDKINIRNGRAAGVAIHDRIIYAHSVVSNCDVNRTFFKLVGRENLDRKRISILKTLKISASFFAAHFIIESGADMGVQRSATYWLTDTYDTDSFFERSQRKLMRHMSYLICYSSSFIDHSLAPLGKNSFCALVGAPFRNKVFWRDNKMSYAEKIMKKVITFFPQLKDCIHIKGCITPVNFYDYTLNAKGAFRGWAPILGQGSVQLISPITKIDGLFLTGHWVTQPEQGGVPMAIASGRATAKLVLQRS